VHAPDPRLRPAADASQAQRPPETFLQSPHHVPPCLRLSPLRCPRGSSSCAPWDGPAARMPDSPSEYCVPGDRPPGHDRATITYASIQR
jgi:hypothetical protein